MSCRVTGSIPASTTDAMSALPDERLLRRLVREQFAQFSDLPIRRIEPGGWDNVSFRLGDGLLAKLPRDERYSAQPSREREALLALCDVCPLRIPVSVGLGQPSDGFASHWSILEWIEGASVAETTDIVAGLPVALAEFLKALHEASSSDAPRPGPENFWRGGPLSALADEFREAVAALPENFDKNTLSAIWKRAIDCPNRRPPVWVHGDIAPSNLLQRGGQLVAVIDFGLVAAGDPACDLAIAWLAFDGDTRKAFLRHYGTRDDQLILRARAWALWKAVLAAADMSQMPEENRDPRHIIQTILEEARTENG